MDRIHNAFEKNAFLLDLDAQDLGDVFRQALVAAVNLGFIPADRAGGVEAELHAREQTASTAIGNSVAIPHAYLDGLDEPLIFFVRLRRALDMCAPDLRPVRYLFILTGPTGRASEHLDTLTQIARLMSEKEFRYDIRQALHREDLLAAIAAFDERSAPEKRKALFEDGLTSTGRFAGGLRADIARRSACYLSDLRDGLSTKSLGSVLFLFFACMAPAITFGGLMQDATGGWIGATEMLLATAVGGVIFSLMGGQPLLILGGTGPHLVFTAILYELCQQFNIPFLPTYAWVGCWSALYLMLLSVTDASCLLRFVTRFTDEIFATLISMIFIVESLKKILASLQEARAERIQHDQAFLALLLSLGTYACAMMLNRVRKTRYLSHGFREFLADFGPTIAIAALMLFGTLFPQVFLEPLSAPDRLEPTASVVDGVKRAWLVPMFGVPLWVCLGAAIPALLVTVLTFLEQNITARLVNSPDHQLHKGPGYHLDLGVVGVLRIFCSILGLPWLVAASVRSLNHVRSLATVEEKVEASGERREEIIHVRETRLTGLAISLLMGCSLLLLPFLKLIPLAALYGLFLYMGVVSLGGNQFIERLIRWITDPALYPKTHYTRTVPTWTIHFFTAIQLLCLTALMLVSLSSFKILFPLLIALLIPVRLLLNKLFSQPDLAALDAATEPDTEESHWV